LLSKKITLLGLTRVWPAAIFLIVLVLIVDLMFALALSGGRVVPPGLTLRYLGMLSA